MRIEDINELIDKYFNNFISIYISNYYNPFVQAYILGKLLPFISHDDYSRFQRESLYYQMTDRDKVVADHLKNSLKEYFDRIKYRTNKAVLDELLTQQKDNIIDKEIMEGKLDPRRLARILREKTGDVYTDFSRTAATELNVARNMGQLSRVIENNPGKDPSDILIYFIGPKDSSTCKFCLDMYHDGASYKIYRLSEVLANGSPYGKKLEIGGPVYIAPAHPLCRHHMVELLPGFTLDDNGRQMYVAPEHREFNNPQK